MEGVTNEQFRGIIKMIIKEIESISDADSKRKVLEKLEGAQRDGWLSLFYVLAIPRWPLR